jgi:hypothetical protein
MTTTTDLPVTVNRYFAAWNATEPQHRLEAGA